MESCIQSFSRPRAGFSTTSLFGAVAVILIGCGPTIPQLRATAANEMNCPVSELELERVDGDTMAVIGCGRETIYSEYCEKTSEGKNCGWRAEPQAEGGE